MVPFGVATATARARPEAPRDVTATPVGSAAVRVALALAQLHAQLGGREAARPVLPDRLAVVGARGGRGRKDDPPRGAVADEDANAIAREERVARDLSQGLVAAGEEKYLF